MSGASSKEEFDQAIECERLKAEVLDILLKFLRRKTSSMRVKRHELITHRMAEALVLQPNPGGLSIMNALNLLDPEGPFGSAEFFLKKRLETEQMLQRATVRLNAILEESGLPNRLALEVYDPKQALGDVAYRLRLA